MERGIRLTKTGVTITNSGYRVNRILEGSGTPRGLNLHLHLAVSRILIQREGLWDR